MTLNLRLHQKKDRSGKKRLGTFDSWNSPQNLLEAFFLVRLDLRLEEADGILSEGGMDGPAADL